MRILLISNGDPNDNLIWSGTVQHIYKSLLSFAEVDYVNVNYNYPFLKNIYKLFSKVVKIFFRKRYDPTYSLLNAWIESKKVQTVLKKKGDYDYIFCPAKSSSICYLKTQIPIVYLTDATFGQMVNYYNHLSNMVKLTIYEGNVIEKRALRKSKLVIAASEWAQKSMIDDYGILPERITVIPFGANIQEINNHKKDFAKINLLFCGVDWERKGGQIAIDTVEFLQNNKIDANLYIVGVIPPCEIDKQYIHVIGFLNKNKYNDKKKIEDIYKKSNIFLLPTKAECAGIVFAEAAGYGIPSITYNTGGIASYVINGETGFLLPLDATYKDFAKCIIGCIEDRNLYEQLSLNAHSYYRSNLNWNVWKKTVEKLLIEAIK